MKKLIFDEKTKWWYSKDGMYMIRRCYWHGKRKPTWDVYELAPDGSYSILNTLPTLNEAREYLDSL